jgi:hypothetical protein
MKNKYFLLALIVFSFSCETEDVAPVVTPPTNTILGCTDANAVNYNSDANSDNGCCKYESLLLNEVLYDPPAGTDGDANGDGTRDANEDEFVELINVSNSNLDISGYEFYDNTNLNQGMPNHVVPQGTVLSSNQAYVVFGGGTINGDFGNAIVHTASAAVLNLNNASDTLTIKNDSGEILILFDIEALSNNPDESYTRLPDICSADFVQHNSASNGLFSPGKKVDGTLF